MSKPTLKARLIAGLLAMGFAPVQGERSHYAAFEPTAARRDKVNAERQAKGLEPLAMDYKLFVGDAGALRKGDCASRSFSLQDTAFYAAVLVEGDKALNAPKESKYE